MRDRRPVPGSTPSIAPLIGRSPLLQRKCACGGSVESEGECQACKEQKLQRSARSGGAAAAVPRTVHDVLRAPGAPLDSATRAAMEPHFRHDFGKVRVHADSKAAASAKAVNAAAYTVGHDVVFASQRYAPQTNRGRQLIAHELAHVVQQAPSADAGSHNIHANLTIGSPDDGAEREADRAAAAVTTKTPAESATPKQRSLQRAPDDEWGKEYDKHKSFLEKPYEEYESGLGDIRPTTEGGLSENKGRPISKSSGAGTPAPPRISIEVLREIYPMVKDAPAGQAEKYLENLNTAFKMMKIDTVEAQAYYLAHAFVESQQFRLLTEVGDKDPAGWQTDAKTPDSDAAKQYYSKTYKKGGDVNPLGNAEFIGRGPVQVTHRPEYVEAIALIEKAGAEYEKKAAAGDEQAKQYAALAKRAVKAIKKDPQQAANPEFTFLFSAAFIKGKGADVSAAYRIPGAEWSGQDAVGGGDFAEGSPQAKALVIKAAAYKDIYCVLMREAKDSGVKAAAAKYKRGCGAKPAVKATGKNY